MQKQQYLPFAVTFQAAVSSDGGQVTLGNEFCIKAVVRASIGNPLIISTMIKSHRRELFIVVLFKVNVCMLEREEGERNLSQISA